MNNTRAIPVAPRIKNIPTPIATKVSTILLLLLLKSLSIQLDIERLFYLFIATTTNLASYRSFSISYLYSANYSGNKTKSKVMLTSVITIPQRISIPSYFLFFKISQSNTNRIRCVRVNVNAEPLLHNSNGVFFLLCSCPAEPAS